MAQITASLVKELRERTGAGMMDCKKALTQTDGNIDAAIDYLRENGIAKAAMCIATSLAASSSVLPSTRVRTPILPPM